MYAIRSYYDFEGGVAALWAALTGRTPRYAMHLDAARRAQSVFQLAVQPRELPEWGALGGVIGRRLVITSYSIHYTKLYDHDEF